MKLSQIVLSLCFLLLIVGCTDDADNQTDPRSYFLVSDRNQLLALEAEIFAAQGACIKQRDDLESDDFGSCPLVQSSGEEELFWGSEMDGVDNSELRAFVARGDFSSLTQQFTEDGTMLEQSAPMPPMMGRFQNGNNNQGVNPFGGRGNRCSHLGPQYEPCVKPWGPGCCKKGSTTSVCYVLWSNGVICVYRRHSFWCSGIPRPPAISWYCPCDDGSC